MIDQQNRWPWPEKVVASVKEFQQGDLVKSPPFFYAADSGNPVWGYTIDMADEGGELFALHPENRPDYGLITTQTCDLDEQSERPRRPWIQIAPVFDMVGLDTNHVLMLKAHRVNHLVLLNLPSILGDHLWVADLRIEFPVEKSWLVGRKPIRSFEDESDHRHLATRLADHRQRPAFSQALMDHVVDPFRAWIKKPGSQRGKAAQDEVSAARLICEGDRLSATTAQLIVITDDGLSESAKDAWEAWWRKTNEAAASSGITLLPNRYETLASLSAADYLRSGGITLER